MSVVHISQSSHVQEQLSLTKAFLQPTIPDESHHERTCCGTRSQDTSRRSNLTNSALVRAAGWCTIISFLFFQSICNHQSKYSRLAWPVFSGTGSTTRNNVPTCTLGPPWRIVLISGVVSKKGSSTGPVLFLYRHCRLLQYSCICHRYRFKSQHRTMNVNALQAVGRTDLQRLAKASAGGLDCLHVATNIPLS